MKLKLSVYDVTRLINELEYLSDTIDTAGETIVDKLVDAGVEKAKELNAIAPKSGLGNNYIYGKHAKRGEGGHVVMQGDDAVFDEFGTGEEGASDPHPLAGVINFSMPPYSGYITGPVVSKNINPETGKHFWYYKPMAGKPYFKEDGYTEGIPSGKQMYNTLQYLRKQKSKIASNEIKDAIKIFK